MVLFPKGIMLIFLTTFPGKAVRSVKGSGKLGTKWLKPQMQMIRVEGLKLKHNFDFDKHSSASAVQPPACKEKRHWSTGAAGSVVIKNPGESGPTPMNACQNYLSM